MRNPKSKKNKFPRKRKRDRFADEANEIEILNSWIESGKPESGWNPLSADPLPANAPIGRTDEGAFSPYSGCKLFAQMPLSNRTKDGLSESDYTKMTDIQRASLPHSLCGRDILGAAKTGSGKTLAFVIPVLEKLYRERWGKEDGVGSIIITPTRELASQIFEVLNAVGKHHDFSSGLLIGGRKDVGTEKEHVNDLNILVCTPGRLLQHMDETPNFDCSQLQVLVLDEADRILDIGFKQALNAIISQLPKQRQTLLFSATQTKSVQDLARLSLKDPEYISVHEKSETATPSRLQQTAIIVPLEQKLDMLWSFIKANRKSNILVFLSTCKQVKFVFEAFKKLHPGIPLKCLHGRMKQDRRMAIYSQFCEQRSVLFSTDVASRGLDFNKAVDWVVQVDCPEDVASYIHRVGRTARYNSGGRSVLFLSLSEEQMLKKLQSAKIPLQFREVNTKRLRPVSSLLAAKLVEYPDLRYLAQRAFATYLKSIHKQKDKEIFDVMKLPIKAFAASLGLPMTPKIRFLNQKNKGKTTPIETSSQHVNDVVAPISEVPTEMAAGDEPVTEEEEAVENDLLSTKATQMDVGDHGDGNTAMPGTRILKNKKLKINQHRPWGTRKVFDEEGNALPPLAALADLKSGNGILQLDKVKERFRKLKEEKEEWDKEDKQQNKQRLREKKNKEKMKLKRAKEEESEAYQEEEEISGSDVEENVGRAAKRLKKYFGSDSDDGEKETKLKSNISTDAISLAEQEELALKLLSSMHS